MLVRRNYGGNLPAPFNLFNGFLGTDIPSFFGQDLSELFNRDEAMMMPAVNIRETEDSFQIELAAPGLRKEDFQVKVERNILTISAHHEEMREEDNPLTAQNQPEGQNPNKSEVADQTQTAGQGPPAATVTQEAPKGQSAVQTQPSTAVQQQTPRYTRREFSYATFQRSFTLPEHVDTENIKATYKDGILTVTVPKQEQHRVRLSRTVEIA